MFVIILFVIVIGMSYWQSRENMQTIRAHLTARGVVNITVTWDWFGGERGNQAFNVAYTDRHGQRCQTRCKISNWSDDIYWREPPEG
ncbi:MAG: hypothetical protein U0559_18205 [Anaerolineae bacterium]